MTEVRAGFSPNHLKSAKVGCGLNGFYLKWWYVRKLGTTAWVVKEADPECWQLSEQPALRLGRGSRPWFKPSNAFLWWDHEIPQPALSEDTSLYSGLLCQTYWKCCGMPEFAEFLLVCPQESGGKRMLCRSAGPEFSFLLILVSLPLPPLPSFPCVLSFFLASEASFQRINIPWLVSGMLDPASGHWSPLPIFLGATAGKQLPMGTRKAPETF